MKHLYIHRYVELMKFWLPVSLLFDGKVKASRCFHQFPKSVISEIESIYCCFIVQRFVQ